MNYSECHSVMNRSVEQAPDSKPYQHLTFTIAINVNRLSCYKVSSIKRPYDGEGTR